MPMSGSDAGSQGARSPRLGALAPRGPVFDGPGLQGAIWANMAIFERQLPQDEPHASERPDRSPGRPAVKRSRNDIQASATIDYKVDTQS